MTAASEPAGRGGRGGDDHRKGLLPAHHPHNPTRYERFWGVLLVLVLVVMAGAATALSAAGVATPPSSLEALDPAIPLRETEFADERLGVTEEGPVVVARLLASRFQFVPSCLVLPADRPVQMRLATTDVIHGVQVAGTNANTMIVPGWISVLNVRFETVGEQLMPCHEFCGTGHNAMWARVRIIEPEAWRAGLRCEDM